MYLLLFSLGIGIHVQLGYRHTNDKVILIFAGLLQRVLLALKRTNCWV